MGNFRAMLGYFGDNRNNRGTVMEADGFNISHSQDTRPIESFKIRRGTLEHLEPLARLAAMAAIADGRWILIEDSEAEGENHGR